MKIKKLSWAVLFGGAGREENIFSLNMNGYKVSVVLVPKEQTTKLRMSISKIKSSGINVLEVDRNEINTKLAPYKKDGLLSIGFPYLVPEDVFF